MEFIRALFSTLKICFRTQSSRWILVGLYLLLSGLAVAPANAVTNADVTITMITAPVLTVDSNNCDAGTGPRAAYVGFEVTNTTGSDLTDLTITLSGLDTANGFDFEGGQADALYLGTLTAGGSRARYFYITYPCTEPLTDNITVTLSDSTGSTASSNFDITTESQIGAPAGGNVELSELGAGAVVGQLIEFDVTYSFGELSAGSEVILQPAGNNDFAAGCLQLEKAEIISSGVNDITVGTLDRLYFVPTVSTTGSGNLLSVRYYFRYLCDGLSTTAAAYAAATSGQQNKYTGNFAEQTPIFFPPAVSAFEVAKSVTPDNVAGSVEYTITITNVSAFDSTIDTIVDTLPVGVTFDGMDVTSDVTDANSSTFPVADDTGVLTWTNIPTESWIVPAGMSIDLVYDATVQDVSGAYINAVSVTSGVTNSGVASAQVTVGDYATIGAAKQMAYTGTVSPWTVIIDYAVENFGNVDLSNVSMPDDLAAVFGVKGTDWSLTSITKLSGPAGFSANGSFDGSVDIELIAANSTLMPGEIGRIRVVLSLINKNGTGLYTNQVTVSADATVEGLPETPSDLSTDGTDPDADGLVGDGSFDNDNNPNEGTVSQIAVETALVGVAKEMTRTGGQGQKHNIQIDYYLENYGDVTIAGISLDDDLSAVFGTLDVAWTFTSISLIAAPTTGDLVQNVNFDGDTDISLVDGALIDMDPGDTAHIRVLLTIEVASPSGNYENSVTVAGASPAGIAISDVSMRGTNPDPNGNGDPT
ncbi:MAG: hypothetical protein IMF08_11350, partial [Proteobacteria bacterium]|nr:hypothetical protein [Pseudomonadota bacterium]